MIVLVAAFADGATDAKTVRARDAASTCANLDCARVFIVNPHLSLK